MLYSPSALRQGYYQVGERLHLNKVAALIDGTERNIHPEWKFNNDVFDKIDWTIEPEENLEKLYAQRAKEIRQTYDYIVLAFSGGSDSRNILNTFLRNNLKLDEIIVSWPVEIAERLTSVSWDYTPINQVSEWELTIRPFLKELKKNYPEIKITIHDWGQNYKEYKIEDDFALSRSVNLSYFADKKWSIDNIKILDENLNSKKNSVLLTGVCKPRICLQDNTYKLYFIDQVGLGTVSEINQIKTEYFYWHPSASKIISKQSHLIIKFFEQNSMFKQFLYLGHQTQRAREFYETAIRAIIYPGMDLSFFQGMKWPGFNFAADSVLMKIDKEMNQKLNFHYNESIQGLQQVIDRKYFQNTNTSDGSKKIVGFITGLYPIAKESVIHK